MSLQSALDELSRVRPLTDAESDALYGTIKREQRRPSAIPDAALTIMRNAAVSHGTTVQEILSASKLRHIAYARWQVMSELRDRGWSFNRIGKLLKRDHSTVIHGVERWKSKKAGTA